MVQGTLVALLMRLEFWAVEMIHRLVELVTESSVVFGAGADVWVVEVAAGTED